MGVQHSCPDLLLSSLCNCYSNSPCGLCHASLSTHISTKVVSYLSSIPDSVIGVSTRYRVHVGGVSSEL